MRDTGFHPFKGRVSRHFGDSLSPADPYLDYYDVRLTKEDIDMLKNDWLTDNNIAFWEEYLEREHLSQHQNAHIILLRPTMSQMLKIIPDTASIKGNLPDFTKTTHIFVPINDRVAEIGEGGSHWSLLVVSIIDGVAFHYDSLYPSNRHDAMLLSQRIGTLIGKDLKFVNLEDSPQQENSSDCGLFVCIHMKHLLLRRLLKVGSSQQINMSMAGRTVDAAAGRKEMMNIIEEYRKEGERRSRSHSPFSHSTNNKNPPKIE